jgi:hypothetical protein
MIEIQVLKSLYEGKNICIQDKFGSKAGICEEVKLTPGEKGNVDFIFTDESRYGLIPKTATPERCVGVVDVLQVFIRDVYVLKD